MQDGTALLALCSAASSVWQGREKVDPGLEREVEGLVNGIEAVDCHEHPDEHAADWAPGGVASYMSLTDYTPKDVWDLLFADYLATLGGSDFELRFRNHHRDEGAFFAWIRPYLPTGPEAFRQLTSAVESVSYRSYLIAFRDLFGMPHQDLDTEAVSALNRQIDRTYRTKGRHAWYDEVRRKANLYAVVAIAPFPFKDAENARRGLFPDRHLPDAYIPQLRVDPLLTGVSGRKQAVKVFGMTYAELFDKTAKAFDIAIDSAAAYQRLLDATFESLAANGMRGIKNATAYDRTLRFARVGVTVADGVFRMRKQPRSEAEMTALEDFAAWELAARADRYALPYVIHTAATGKPEWSNPENLRPMIAAFPRARFVLLHAGHPYYETACGLAREFPHVYIDMTWTPMIAADPIEAYLKVVRLAPAERILWGGDMGSVEGMYGMWKLTRAILAQAYARLVAGKQMTFEQASGHAHKVLRLNPGNLYSL
jgi:hypothetical protein